MPYGGRGRVQRHHNDGDRMNNTRENIAFLCVKHHKDAHRALDGKIGGGARPRINQLLTDRATANAQRARTMRASGMSSGAIGKELRVHPTSVLRWFRKYPE